MYASSQNGNSCLQRDRRGGGKGFIGVGAERGKAIRSACLYTLQRGLTITIEWFEFAAGGRALWIDGAAATFAHCAAKGDTAGYLLRSAAHAQVVAVAWFGEFQGNGAAEERLRLAPVEGDAKEGAAGAATLTGVAQDSGRPQQQNCMTKTNGPPVRASGLYWVPKVSK
jgi:hypothetical protein